MFYLRRPRVDWLWWQLGSGERQRGSSASSPCVAARTGSAPRSRRRYDQVEGLRCDRHSRCTGCRRRRKRWQRRRCRQARCPRPGTPRLWCPPCGRTGRTCAEALWSLPRRERWACYRSSSPSIRTGTALVPVLWWVPRHLSGLLHTEVKVVFFSLCTFMGVLSYQVGKECICASSSNTQG